MRLLLLAPYFHPYQNPRADRWTAVVRQWAKHGHEVHVVCSRHQENEGHIVWNDIHLHRTGFNSAKEWMYAQFPQLPQRGQAQPGSGIFAAANRALLQSWYWPDDAWLWIGPARKTARQLLKQGNWDALLSVSLPFSAHWIAHGLKAQNPTLTWLADIGDPLALQTDHPLNNPILYQKKNRRAERSVLENADVATLTNDNLRTKYLELFPDLQTPLHVIPPLASFLRDPNCAPQPFQIGYFGSFFRNIREPARLLQLLKALPEPWTLNLYGAVFEEFHQTFQPFRNRIRFHGPVSREAAQIAMQEMEALVLLGNTTSFQLPSKWADYLLSGRPILHIRQTTDDPALDFLNGYSLVMSVLAEENNWEQQALAFFESCRHRQAGKDELEKWERFFAPATIAAAYEGLLLRNITR